MGITRKLNKESPMYCYPIYTNISWSVLTINNPTQIKSKKIDKKKRKSK